MSARDKFHDAVVAALIAAGWTITHDPLTIRYDGTKFDIDLGAEKLIGAEKAGRKIAVEVKSFLRSSTITDFHNAMGQCGNYQFAIQKEQLDRMVFMAVPRHAYKEMQQSKFYFDRLKSASIGLIVFNEVNETIIAWIE